MCDGVLISTERGKDREVAGHVEQRGDDAAVEDPDVVERRLARREDDAGGGSVRIFQLYPEESMDRDLEDALTRGSSPSC